MRFVVDAQLPPALARRISSAGYLCEHVVDCGLLTGPDPAIRASLLARVDADLGRIAAALEAGERLVEVV